MNAFEFYQKPSISHSTYAGNHRNEAEVVAINSNFILCYQHEVDYILEKALFFEGGTVSP